MKAGVKADFQRKVERLPANQTGQRRRGAGTVGRSLQVSVIRLLGGQGDAALGANSRARHFAVRQFVFGQDGSRREDFVANVALDPSVSGRRQQEIGAGWDVGAARRMVGALHVRFQLASRLARFAAVSAMEAQVEHRRGRRAAVHLFRLLHFSGWNWDWAFVRCDGQRDFVVLVVEVNVTFQQKFDGEGLRAERTLEQGHGLLLLFDGQDFRSVGNGDVGVEFLLGAEDGRSFVGGGATGTAEEFRLAAVLDGQVNLDRDFRVERFFAQSAAVEMMGVHVQQVFLEFVGRRKALDARRATVLVPAGHEMPGHVSLESFGLGLFEFRWALRARVTAFFFRFVPFLGATQIGREVLRVRLLDGLADFSRRGWTVESKNIGQAVGRQGVLLQGRQVAEAQGAQLTGVKESVLLLDRISDAIVANTATQGS